MNIFEKLIGLNKENDSFLSDWDRRYHGGYLLVSDKTGKNYKPAYVNDRVGSIARIGTLELNMHQESPVDIKVWLPAAGTYNTPYGPVLIEQNPQRQWCRTFSNKTYRLSLRENLSKLVNHINEPVWTSLKDAQPNYSFALSLFFSVRHNDPVSSSLHYRERLVGWIDWKGKRISIIYSCLNQEVEDLLKRQGADQWKIVKN